MFLGESLPIPMYGIFNYIWLFFMVNVGRYIPIAFLWIPWAMKKVFNNGGRIFFVMFCLCCTPFSGEFVSLPPHLLAGISLLIVRDLICDGCAQQLFSLEGV